MFKLSGRLALISSIFVIVLIILSAGNIMLNHAQTLTNVGIVPYKVKGNADLASPVSESF
jgi:hypothetical protein